MTTFSLPFVPFISSNLLRESIIAQYACTRESIVEEIRGLDVSVNDGVLVRCGEGTEEGGEVRSKHWEGRLSVVCLGGNKSVRGMERERGGTDSEVLVSIERHDCDDLIFVSDRSDEIRDVVPSPITTHSSVRIP